MLLRVRVRVGGANAFGRALLERQCSFGCAQFLLHLRNRNAIILRVRVCYANAFQYAYELGMSMLLRARSER